ncbi:MAG: efflux RND transporter permease subunit, partial [Bacteroidota bacterium]|nr:efflux RND transporter permease subunit [Bacteroidota bacterium]
QDAQRKVNAIQKNLPKDCDPPSLQKFDMNDFPIMQIGVTSNLPETELYDLVKNRFKPELNQIKGMAQVKMLGGTEREIQININSNKLETYDLSILNVTNAIQKANLEFPTGKIKDEAGQTSIRLSGKFISTDQINDLVVKYDKNDTPIRIKDVAEVTDAQKEADVFVRADGKNSIGLLILKQSDANAVELSKSIREKLTQLEEQYKPQQLHFNIPKDTSIFTMDAAHSVLEDLLLAVLLVAFVMLFFLHSVRNSAIVLFAIPTSLISTFIVMYLSGFTLNLLTLLGLSLVIGILVDDAIVVIENIHRHLEMDKSAVRASYDAIREIGLTVSSITLVIVVVFVPVAMTTGLVSDLLREFSITVAIATLCSLFVSFTLVPLLSSRFSKLERLNPNKPIGMFVHKFESGIDHFSSFMQHTLSWAFRHKIITLVSVLLLFFSSFLLVAKGFIGSEFMNAGDRGEFMIELELPKDATPEMTNQLASQAEKYILTIPEVTNMFSIVGTTLISQEGQTVPRKAQINVKLVNSDKRSVSCDLISRRTKIALEQRLVDCKVKALPASSFQAPIQVILQGSNVPELMKWSKIIKKEVEAVKGTSETDLSVEDGNPEIHVEVDRDKMGALGVDIATVGMTMQTAFSGNNDAKFKDKGEDYDIEIKLDQFDRQNINNISRLTVPNKDGKLIQIGQFATITEGTGPSQLDRKNRFPSVSVNSYTLGRPSGVIGEEIKERLAHLNIPGDITISYGGDLENQTKAFASLLFALIISIFVVYLIMVALYDSYVYPFVVLFSIPLALIGALLALALAKQTLSIFTLLGMIMLIGLVAKNAILIVDFANHMKKEGLKVKEALFEASRVRFRPILMTTLAMIFGMLPIALATGPGAEWKNGLAWVLIGGLASSLFLTLIVVPLVYYIFDRILERFHLIPKPHEEIINL